MAENNKQAVHLTLSPEDKATLDEVARQFEGNRSMGARFVISEFRRWLQSCDVARQEADRGKPDSGYDA